MSVDAAATPIPCCVCGATDARLWRTAPDNLLGGDTVYTAVRCTACGTARLQPRPPAEEMGKFYTPATYARAEETGELARRLDAFFDRQAERAVAALGSPTPGRLLDVGCGDGRFLAAMRARGWSGVGIETDPVAADLARHRSGCEIRETPLESSGFPPDTFDLISLLHVIEHVPDPQSTILFAFQILKSGGTLLLALPNAASVEAQVFGKNWYQLDLPRHFWGFTPRGLTRLVEQCGFRGPCLRYLPFFFVPQSLRNLVHTVRPKKQAFDVPIESSGDGESGRKTTVFLRLLATSERLGRWLPGEVMELTAIKPAPKPVGEKERTEAEA